MCDNLEKLKEITSKLQEPRELIEFKSLDEEGITQYIFDKGTAITFNIYSDKDVSVAKTLIPHDVEFEEHVHINSYEIIIVLRGRLEFIVDDEVRVLHKYDKISINKNQKHSAKALSTVEILAIAVPSDDGFPE